MSAMSNSLHPHPPLLGNQYESDRVLQTALARIIPSKEIGRVQQDLKRFGGRVTDELQVFHEDCFANEPKLHSIDAWGRRNDRIIVTQGWKELHNEAAREGIVALGYERDIGEYSRVWQMAKLYLFNGSSGGVTCPLAMTDGAARLFEIFKTSETQEIYKHLVSRDPKLFWTSGQWMTEMTGGSDIGNTETVARKQKDGSYRLYGLKYFTSAATSEVAVTLARIEDDNGKVISGSKGLSCFYLFTHKDEGSRLNEIQIRRLKNKLGTRSLPTAELELQGTPAVLLGEVGRGVRTISVLFNITRIYNAACAVSTMRRGFALAQDYATKRRVFGRLLIDQPLHARTLAAMQIEIQAALLLVLDVAHLLGRVETKSVASDPRESAKGDDAPGIEDEDAVLLRILTPLAKLYTAKQAVAQASETLECFGGAGYMEDTGLPRLLKEAQVLPIWEGTTNVLSLDVFRAFATGADLSVFIKRVCANVASAEKLDSAELRDLQPLAQSVRIFAEALPELIRNSSDPKDPSVHAANAREFSFRLARIYMGGLLIQHAGFTKDSADIEAARRWVLTYIQPFSPNRLPVGYGHAIQSDALLAASGISPKAKL